MFNFEAETGLNQAVVELECAISKRGLIDAISNEDDDLTLIYPASKYPGFASLLKINANCETTYSKEIDVCGNGLNFQCCTLSLCGRMAAFALNDGCKIRAWSLEKEALVEELVRSNTTTTTITCLSLSQDKGKDKWYLAATSIKKSLHVFMIEEAATKKSASLTGSMYNYFAGSENWIKYELKHDSQSPKLCTLVNGMLYLVDDVC